MFKLLTLYIYFFIIIFSILGYGRINTIFKKKNNVAYFDGLYGICIILIISYVTNIFFSHNYILNSIIILVGLSIFFNDYLKNFHNRKNELPLIFIIFTITFIGLLMYKNHDDFFYYHFPYTIILTNFEKVIGLGNLNHGFRTPSSIFYLNSIFYLPGVKYYLLNSGAAYIFGFSNLILISIIKKYLKKNKLNFIFFLSILSLAYINTSFARIAEHGTDRSALILIFLAAIYYLESVNFHKNLRGNELNNYVTKLAIIFGLIVSLKTFYIIYFFIILVWFYEINLYKNFKKNLTYIANNKSIYIFLILIFFTIFTIFTNTGCLVYPAKFTCFESIEWSIPLEQVTQMKQWYEQWSKAGATPIFRVENPENYLRDFNWVNNWFQTYFFTKVTDNILLIFILLMITYGFFRGNINKLKNENNFKYIIFYIVIILLSIEWFLNHPALRYGGYSLLALIFFIPFSSFLSRIQKNKNNYNFKTYTLISIIFFAFIIKNVDRINFEHNFYGYNPLKDTFFYINNDGFILNDEVKKKYLNKKKRYLIIK